MPATSIAICNFKGGVGKTVLSVNLAVALANKSRSGKPLKVLLVDLDPQANASIYALGQQYWNREVYPKPKRSLYGVMHNFLKKGAKLTPDDIFGANPHFTSPVFAMPDDQTENARSLHWPSLHLLPSHYNLAETEMLLAAQPKGGMGIANEVKPVQYDAILRHIFASITDDYDYIILDCPPSIYHLTGNALDFADNYLIPFIPDFLSASGISWLIMQIEKRLSESKAAKGKQVRALVSNLWDNTGEARIHKRFMQEISQKLKSEWSKLKPFAQLLQGCQVLEGLEHSTAVARSVEDCRPVVEYDDHVPPKKQIESLADKVMKWE